MSKNLYTHFLPLDLKNRFHFKTFTEPRNVVQPYYHYIPTADRKKKNRGEEEYDDNDLDSIHSEDLVYANYNSKELDKPHYESSRKIYLASIRKKPKVETISPLVPKDLSQQEWNVS